MVGSLNADRTEAAPEAEHFGVRGRDEDGEGELSLRTW